MNMKKRTAVIVAVSFMALFWGFMGFSFWLSAVEAINPYMFTDITVFEKLEPYEVKEISDPQKLKGLEIVDSYCRKVKYDGKIFRVYAYEFATAEDAQTYCNRFFRLGESVRASYTRLTWFSYRHYGLYENYTFRVERISWVGNAEFINWLTEDFDVDIEALFWADVQNRQ